MDPNNENKNHLDDTIVFDVDSMPSDTNSKSEKVSNIDDEESVNVIKEKNEILDFTSSGEIDPEVIDASKEKNAAIPKKKKKRKLKLVRKIKDWWSLLSKSKKILFSTIFVLSIVFITLLLLVLFKGDKKESVKHTKDIIVEEENYVYKNGTLIFKDNSGEYGTYKCKNKDEKHCYVAYLSNEDDFTKDVYIDREGNPKIFRSSVVNNDYVFIVDNKKGSNEDIILYSIKSNANVGNYKLVKQVKNNKNLAILKDSENNYGMLDLSEGTPKTLINFHYKYIGVNEDETSSKYVVLVKNDQYYVATFDENTVSTAFSDKIVEFNDNYIVTKDANERYQIYDYEGHELQKQKAIFIKLNNAYYAFLADNGITVYDQTGLKYNESPIGLSSTDYNRKIVLDANNQVISNDIAFEISSDEDEIAINRGKTIDKLPVREAMANKDHPFVSYYNGILYFYADENKDSIIGKYTCKNRNTPGEFNNCYIASSTKISNNDMTYDVPNGIVSILNNRYVLIRDSLSVPNIYLYDLKESKKLGPYGVVEVFDAVSSTETMKAANGVYIIAKNSKGQFGLLRVNSSSVDFVLNFEYSEIEKEGEYFLAKKSSGTYVLYNNSGTEASKDVAGKVLSYNDNYIVAKTGNNYNIYKRDGQKIDNNNYAYIRLFQQYYVAISLNNTLGVYEYTNPGVNVFKTAINIKASDSWRSSDSFKVISTSPYVVRINDGEHNGDYTAESKNNEQSNDNSSQTNTNEQNTETGNN